MRNTVMDENDGVGTGTALFVVELPCFDIYK
jgi:hypothetical protein